MRTRRIVTPCAAALALLALASCKAREEVPPPPPPPSLYQRLGGATAVEAVVKAFAGRCLEDPRINKKFTRSDPDRLVSMLIEQVCALSGGGCQYTGRSMKEAHVNMGVTEGEFNALVENLVATLNQFDVPAAEQEELLAVLGAMKGDIVEVAGPATGTALPRAFVPWRRE
jgi:hemoglobin